MSNSNNNGPLQIRNPNVGNVGEKMKKVGTSKIVVSPTRQGNNRSNTPRNKGLANNAAGTPKSKPLSGKALPFLPRYLTVNAIKNLYYNKTVNKANMKKNICNYVDYKKKTSELLKILEDLQNQIKKNPTNYQQKILNKWEKETRNRVNYNVKNNIKNIRSIGNLEINKQIDPKTIKKIKWIKEQNELVQKTFYALKRISYIIEKLRLNKNDYSKLRNFLNYTLKNKNTHKIIDKPENRRGKVCAVNTKVINELVNKYKIGTSTINNFINILYEYKKNNISGLHMFTNTLVGLTKNEKYYKPNEIMKKKLGVVNKQILKSSSGIRKLTINIEGEQINEFFDLIYRDMVHDDSLTKIEDFKSVMKIFVKPTSNKINQFINLENNLSKSKANINSKRILHEEILNPNKKTVSIREFNKVRPPRYKMTRTLIRHIFNGETPKYKFFYILLDIDPKGTLTKYVNQLKHGQRQRAKFLVTPASLLDPGGLYWNRPGVSPIPYFKDALKLEGGTKASLIAIDSTMLDVKINYKDEGQVWGNTRIKIVFNPRRGYQILLNDNIIRTSTKAKAITKEEKLGKFLGDFLLILNTLILQDTHTEPVAFATGDANAAVIYKFMCDIIRKERRNKKKARLFYVGSDSKYFSLKTLDMNDIIIKNTKGMNIKRRKVHNRQIGSSSYKYNNTSSINGNNNDRQNLSNNNANYNN
jgi:hypothetical protein